MASSGPNGPSSGTNNSDFGATGWTNPGNVTASDNSRATCSLSGGTFSDKLVATGFGFAIPAGATINGIVVEWEKNGGAANNLTDYRARIVKGGTVGNTDKSIAGAWPASDTYISYGASNDLWGETWTATDINAATFGVALAATAGLGAETPALDHVRITVYYTVAVAGHVRRLLMGLG